MRFTTVRAYRRGRGSHLDSVAGEIRGAFLLGAVVIAAALAVLVEQATHHSFDLLPLEGIGVAVSLFVVLRLVRLVRALESIARAAEASERRFRLVFERSPLGISLGRDGMMSETNSELHRMLGYTAEEFAQMHYTAVTHPDDRLREEQIDLDEGRRDSFTIDKRYRRKDGTWIAVRAHVALDLEDGLGVSLIEDVTAQRQLEEQLRQSQKMEAIGQLAGGVAHDFNNLMTAVIGYSDLLLRDRPDERVEAIRESAVRASELTRQLLAFSRRQVLQTCEVDLRDVVARMEQLLRRLIGEHVRLETVFGEEPVVVRADTTQLEQVVMNLTVNARDAMPAGGNVTIAVFSSDGHAILSVLDSGVGMDDEVRSHIFEPFFTTKPLGESTGLGLSTVHGIVGQTGGTIDVASEPGRGTVFTVRFPLAAPARLPELPWPATLVD